MIELDFKQEVIKLTPPATVSGFTLMGLPLQDWVYVATIIYILVQCFAILYALLRKDKKDDPE